MTKKRMTETEWCQKICRECTFKKDADLEKHRIYHLVGCINEEKYLDFMKFLDKARLTSTKDPIHIVLESYGGQAASSFAIYDSLMNLRNLGIPVKVTAYGAALSGGGIILQAGSPREVSKNCIFMMHEIVAISWGSRGEREDMEEFFDMFDNSLYKLYSEKTGKSVKTIKKDIKRKMNFMTAEQAVEYGLADKII